MGLHQTLQSLAGTTFQSSATSNDDIIHALMLRRARERGLALPTGDEPERYKYHGAFVFDPIGGLHEHVCYLDLSSLYPNLLRALNASPETIIGTDDQRVRTTFEVNDGTVSPFGVSVEEFRSWDWTSPDQVGVPREACVWSYIDTRPVKWLRKGESYGEYTDGRYKMVFDPSKGKIRWRDDPDSVREHSQRCYFLAPRYVEGFVPSLVGDLIDLKNEYEGQMYSAVKRIVNSIYGTLGFSSYQYDTSFALYDWRIAESVTLAGRRVIEHTGEVAVERLQSRYDESQDGDGAAASTVADSDGRRDDATCDVYISHGDTDGVGVAVDADVLRSHVLPYVHEIADYLNHDADGYASFMPETFGVDPSRHYMEVEVESYSPRLFVPRSSGATSDTRRDGVKKRYAERVTWEEGAECDELDVTGFEYVRSDTADVTAEAQDRVLETILTDPPQQAKSSVYEYLRETLSAIRDGDVDLARIGKRSGLGQSLDEYGTSSRTPQPVYRGAKYADQHVDGEAISEGSKPMCFYVDAVACGDDCLGDHPPTYSAETAEDGDPVDAIAVEDPTNLPPCITIDYDTTAEKLVENPVRPIVETMGWDWTAIEHGHEQVRFGEVNA